VSACVCVSVCECVYLCMCVCVCVCVCVCACVCVCVCTFYLLSVVQCSPRCAACFASLAHALSLPRLVSPMFFSPTYSPYIISCQSLSLMYHFECVAHVHTHSLLLSFPHTHTHSLVSLVSCDSKCAAYFFAFLSLTFSRSSSFSRMNILSLTVSLSRTHTRSCLSFVCHGSRRACMLSTRTL